MKESMYQKYKRERDQLKAILDKDVQHFALTRDRNEFAKRLKYLVECMLRYRSEQ
jgi:hypothetical protein